MTLIKSISGIRGTIGGETGNNLTPIDIVKFTVAYARFISGKNDGKRLKIVIGRDARISGEMVNDLIEGTLLGCGADVINVGLCTTPGTEMAVITHKADGRNHHYRIAQPEAVECAETAQREGRISQRRRRKAGACTCRGQ